MTKDGDIIYPFEDISILIVDDDRMMTRLVRDALLTFGFKDIDTDHDGIKALAKTNTKPYGFIICDWRIKGISGIDFIKEIRKNKSSPNRFSPIIMVTGKNTKQDVSEARDAGVNEFLVKPITAKALYSHIIAIIENPRNFIISRNYIGPDRRRKDMPIPTGSKGRRKEDD